MQTLPCTPVETLAPLSARNLQAAANRNPGIVPPWLQGRPVAPEAPVGDDVPRILGGAAPTAYDPAPIVDEDTPRIWAIS